MPFTGCDFISICSSEITRKWSSRSPSALDILKLKTLQWKVNHYCAGFSLTPGLGLKLC